MFRTLLSRDFLRCVWKKAESDDIFGRSAQLSYYFLLGIFPLLLFLLSLFAFLDSGGGHLRRKLVVYLGSMIPGAALQLVVTTMDEIVSAGAGGKLSLGLLGALWAASSGMNAIGETLNVAYGVRETRPWWKVRLVSGALTMALSVLIVSALAIVLYGGEVGRFLAHQIHEGSAFAMTWRVLQWPIALVFVFITVQLIYHFAPNLRTKERVQKFKASDYRRRWITPGVIVAVTIWVLVSLGFRLYLHFFNSYSATYGSLGAVIILMLWFYLTGAAILLGGEINCEFERRQSETLSSHGPKK